MEQFKFCVEHTISQNFTIKANSVEEAEKKLIEEYKKGTLLSFQTGAQITNRQMAVLEPFETYFYTFSIDEANNA